MVCIHHLEIRLSIVRTWYSCDSAFHCLNPSLSDPAFHCPNLVLLRFSFPLSEPITSAFVLFAAFHYSFAFLQVHEIKCNMHDVLIMYACSFSSHSFS